MNLLITILFFTLLVCVFKPTYGCMEMNTEEKEKYSGIHWGYYNDQAKEIIGPEFWYTQFPACNGEQQSPIDINSKKNRHTLCSASSNKNSLQLSGSCLKAKMEKHETDYKWVAQNENSCGAKGRDRSEFYNLLQFHMHAPSEHLINNKASDIETHFVHSSKDGKQLLVIGVLMNSDDTAIDNPWIEKVFKSSFNEEETATKLTIDIGEAYDEFIKVKSKFYNYKGSLTTPPCTEIVDWWVIKEPVIISKRQLLLFQTQMKKLSLTNHGQNARPVQPINSRKIKANRKAIRV